MCKNWVWLRLGDFLSELPKSTLPASCSEDNGAYAFYCSSSEPKATDTWLQEQPAILMGTGGTASVHLGKDRYAYSTDTWAIRIKESSSLTQPYAYRVLELSLPKIDYTGFEGSGLRHLRKSYIKEFRFLAPLDLASQKRIVSILDTIDTAIEKTEALIDKYRQIKAGLMHDLFTRGVLPNGQLRPPREQAPELYQETAIGWIPREWVVSTLRVCLLANPTNGIYKSADQIGAEGTLMVGQTAFTAERSVDFSLCRRGVVSPAEIRHYGLAEGDVLMTRVFATIEGVGLPTLVPHIPEPAVYESNMMRLQVNLRSVIPRFLFEWLRSPATRSHISSRVNASNQCSVNQSAINSLPVPIPDPDSDEQNWINSRIEAAEKRIDSEVAILGKLKKQKSGLMHDLLTGKVPVTIEHKTTTTEAVA